MPLTVHVRREFLCGACCAAPRQCLVSSHVRLRPDVSAVAYWRWNVEDDVCGICRMAFDACCPDCKTPGEDCPPAWGRCRHAFHMHCIEKWVTRDAPALCPICRQEWEYRVD